MQEQIIVIQTGNTTATGDRVSNFDTPEEASRHVEELLEGGHPRDSISVYRASPLVMQVTQRPVVSFGEVSKGEMRIPEMPRDEFSHREELSESDLSTALSDLRS